MVQFAEADQQEILRINQELKELWEMIAEIQIQINEFEHTPIVCKKNGPTGGGIIEGAVYVRPPGVARTTRVMNSAQMHDLLELAAEKQARRILEVSRRIGLVSRPTSTERFDEELEGL